MTPTFWLTKASPHLRARAAWAGIFALAALVMAFTRPAPPPRTAEGVAAMLGAAVGGEVRADDFVWEARGGFWSDAFLGRRVLFVAKKAGGSHADLFRARVRLTRSGRPMSLTQVRNLSASPLGHEHDLVAQGRHAAFITSAFGAVRGVTLLDLEGEGGAREAATRRQRLAAAIESWLDTGDARGVGRTEITFGSPPVEARHELQGDLLVLALGTEPVPAALDVRDGSLNTGPQNALFAASQRIPHRPAALGEVVARALGALVGSDAERAARAANRAIAGLEARVLTKRRADTIGEVAGAAAPPGESFPPPAIAPVAQPAVPGEGVWTAARGARAEGSSPIFAYETAIRPDPRTTATLVRLVAIDTRQVDLRLSAGVDEPRSPTGLHGRGAAPDGVAADRIVAAFAGGPAGHLADSGIEPGFVADRRVLVPPVKGLATVALAEDGRVAIGAWPHDAELVPPSTSLRQTADAILGWSGPARASVARPSEPLERSALGLLPSGQLVYAWSIAARIEDLSRALALAGCTYAVPLAAAPFPAGLVYTRSGAPAEPLSRAMSLLADPLTPGSANDRFYLVLRSAGPPGGAALTPDSGKQPSPAWLPAIHAGAVTALGAQIRITTFAPGRVAFLLRPGGREPSTKSMAALPSTLAEADRARLIAAMGLGAGKRRGARGLVVEGSVGIPLRGEDAGLLAFDHGRPRLLRSTEMSSFDGIDATELPLTADEGKLRPEARDVGSMRSRAAACVLPDGTFAVAATTFDSDEAATAALLDLGCARVVALDRGSHAPAFLHRAGTDAAPEARYEATTIYAVEIPLSGRATLLEQR